MNFRFPRLLLIRSPTGVLTKVMFPWRSARLTLGRTAGVVIPYKGDHVALTETNIAPEKLGHPKKKFIFQACIFRGYVKLKGCKGRFAISVVFFGMFYFLPSTS